MADRSGVEISPEHVIAQPTAAQETTPLIANKSGIRDEEALGAPAAQDSKLPGSNRSVFGIISVLLIGVFVANADTTLMMATFVQISSEFGDLDSGSWLMTSFGLATCATQPLYGKLSDIFGRRGILQMSYVLFAVGTAASGLSRNMTEIILGRVVQGAGAAGMVSMVSILLTDLVPLQEVAQYRSYVNIFSTVGRSCGGLIGGYLTQAIGWRYTFLCQCPLLILSIVLVWWKLEEPKQAGHVEQSMLTKLRRIDFLGAFFMSITLVCILLALDMGGEKYPWRHPLIIGLFVGAIVSALVFCLVEKFWAKEPIFPLSLLSHYVVATSYAILTIQTAIQVALMFLVPLYFQVTQNASTGEAGAHFLPAIVGNTIGGLAVGAWIKRTGRYKLPTVLSSVSALACFTLLIAFWRGDTGVWQSLFIFPGGLAAGMAQSAVFVGLTAGVERKDIAIAASGLYLSSNLGAVAGVSGGSAVFQAGLRASLDEVLGGEPNGEEIAQKVLSDVGFLQSLHGRVHGLVVSAYVAGIQKTYGVSLVLAGVLLVIGLASRETKIQ
ncbi:hypothetical protein MBLNU459_g5939t2 [Dothideomycetes sp. NU459]